MIYLIPHISDGIQFIINFLTVYSYSLVLIFTTFLLTGLLIGFLSLNFLKR